jgi:hypothetical protein
MAGMNKLKIAFELIKEIPKLYLQKIDSWCEIVNIENDIRNLSNSFFLDALRQDAHELSEITCIPYISFLNKAKDMLLQGVEMREVIYHFDSLWFELKFRRD